MFALRRLPLLSVQLVIRTLTVLELLFLSKTSPTMRTEVLAEMPGSRDCRIRLDRANIKITFFNGRSRDTVTIEAGRTVMINTVWIRVIGTRIIAADVQKACSELLAFSRATITSVVVGFRGEHWIPMVARLPLAQTPEAILEDEQVEHVLSLERHLPMCRLAPNDG